MLLLKIGAMSLVMSFWSVVATGNPAFQRTVCASLTIVQPRGLFCFLLSFRNLEHGPERRCRGFNSTHVASAAWKNRALPARAHAPRWHTCGVMSSQDRWAGGSSSLLFGHVRSEDYQGRER